MLTQAKLKELLHYNPDTGVFTWKESNGRVKDGYVAGTNSKGYISIAIDKKRYLAHRLAWLYVYGNFPTQEIDHINRIKSDNRIKNLRDVTHYENMRNSEKSINGGIDFVKSRNRFRVRVSLEGKRKYLGFYKEYNEAENRLKEFKSGYISVLSTIRMPDNINCITK